MDVEGFSIGNVEVLEPSAETLPSAGSVEGVKNALRIEPLVSMAGYIADVLSELTGSGEPFRVDLVWFPLENCHQLHGGEGADGVPVDRGGGVSFRVYSRPGLL